MAARTVLTTASLVVGAVLAGIVAVLIGARFLVPDPWNGTTFATASPAPSFDGLLLDSGEPADLDDWDGMARIVFFGYTSCPDVCPLTLSTAAKALDDLGADADEVQVVMVSVDPDRDTLDDLGVYVRHFDESFVGVSGDFETVGAVATAYGVYFDPQEPGDNGFYEVDHTATLMGIDRDGNLKVIWSPDIEADALRDDLDKLLG